MDFDSTPDMTEGNDPGGVVNSDDDNFAGGNGRLGEDEDDASTGGGSITETGGNTWLKGSARIFNPANRVIHASMAA